MKNKLNFTKASIETLPIPDKGKRKYYYDDKEDGLVIAVLSSGKKSFYLYKKINSRPERIYIAPYPDMKIPEARKQCAILKAQIAQGINPQDEKRNIRKEITLGEFFTEYMEKYSKPHKASWKYDENEIPAYFGHWFNRKLSSITNKEIRDLHNDIFNKKFKKNGVKRGGNSQANRALERIRAMYNKAIEWGWNGENPTKGIRKFKEVKRDRFILPIELPFFLSALEAEENKTTRDFFKISLMTGARKSNVLAMRWEEVDFMLDTWRIPKTKNGDPQTIPLIPEAVKLLKERAKELAKTSPWVFPSDKTNSHLADPKKSWNRIRNTGTIEIWKQNEEIAELIKNVEERLNNANNYGFTELKLISEIQKEAESLDIELPRGILDLRIHDIRRTLGSYQAMSGASLPIIGKTLGHKSSQATEIYARMNLDPIRNSMQDATDQIFSFKNK